MDVKGQFTQDRTEFEWETQDSLWSVDLWWPLGTQTSWMLSISKPLSGYCGNPNECSHVYGHFSKDSMDDSQQTREVSGQIKRAQELRQRTICKWHHLSYNLRLTRLSNSYSLSFLCVNSLEWMNVVLKYLAHLHILLLRLCFFT